MILIASIMPIVALLGALTVFRLKAWQASLAALAVGVASAVFAAGMPVCDIAPTMFSGLLFALCPICLVVLAALFVYAVTTESGAMSRIRSDLASVSDDQRILALLIVWGFGNFMEGMAGFGTAVAIPAAILVGVGFDPFKAVTMCLVANTTSTAFGSVGVPLMTLSKESGCDLAGLVQMTVFVQLAITAAGPVLVLLMLGGFKALKGMWGWMSASSAAFLVPSMLASCFFGCELPNIVGGIGVMLVITCVSRRGKQPSSASGKVVWAWQPFIFVVLLLAINGLLPQSFKRYITPGALVLAGGFVGALAQGVEVKKLFSLLADTFVRYLPAFATICFVVILARIMDKSNMISVIAGALVSLTGSAYPFFSAALGALGGFITGSGTSSCVLFGRLQAEVAAALNESPSLLAAANVMGAGIGKMICPQSIAIGTAAAGLVGRESEIFKRMLPWFFCVILFACALVSVAALFL